MENNSWWKIITLTEQSLSCYILIVNYGCHVSSPYAMWKGHPNTLLNLSVYLHSFFTSPFYTSWLLREMLMNAIKLTGLVLSFKTNSLYLDKRRFYFSYCIWTNLIVIKMQIQVFCSLFHRSSKSSCVQTSLKLILWFLKAVKVLL